MFPCEMIETDAMATAGERLTAAWQGFIDACETVKAAACEDQEGADYRSTVEDAMADQVLAYIQFVKAYNLRETSGKQANGLR
jgi:hypothetical protein